VSWPQAIRHGISGLIALFTVTRLVVWFPQCLEMIHLPAGGVTHDLWAWAPLVLDLGAIVAVASPTSFRNLLDLARLMRPPGAKP
jgi:hypothetical protein